MQRRHATRWPMSASTLSRGRTHDEQVGPRERERERERERMGSVSEWY